MSESMATDQRIAIARSNLVHSSAQVALLALSSIKHLLPLDTVREWSSSLHAISPVFQTDLIDDVLELAMARRLVTEPFLQFMKLREMEVVTTMSGIMGNVCLVPRLLAIANEEYQTFLQSSVLRSIGKILPRLQRNIDARNQAYAKLISIVKTRVDCQPLIDAFKILEVAELSAMRHQAGMTGRASIVHLTSNSLRESPMVKYVNAVRKRYAAEEALQATLEAFEDKVTELLVSRRLTDQLGVAEAAWLRSAAVLAERAAVKEVTLAEAEASSRRRLESSRGASLEECVPWTDMSVSEGLTDESSVMMVVLESAVHPVYNTLRHIPSVAEAYKSVIASSDKIRLSREYDQRVHKKVEKMDKYNPVESAVRTAVVIKSARMALQASIERHEALGLVIRAARLVID